jgi:hypothetical protein
MKFIHFQLYWGDNFGDSILPNNCSNGRYNLNAAFLFGSASIGVFLSDVTIEMLCVFFHTS